ncbi:UNVERIFIED_CONTAM: hypothetical protein FKN15_046029 [Acipenser sinensis]
MERSRPRVLTGPVSVGIVYSKEDKGHFWPGVILQAGTQGIQGYTFLCHGLFSRSRSIVGYQDLPCLFAQFNLFLDSIKVNQLF